MVDYLTDNWWLLLLKGLAAILFGVVAVVWPNLSTNDLAMAAGLLLIAFGALDIILGLQGTDSQRLWFLPLLLGIGEVAASVYLLRNPGGVNMAELVRVLGFVLIAKGIIEVIQAFTDVDQSRLRWLLTSGGAIAAAVGLFLTRYSGSHRVDDFLWLLGVFGLLTGAIAIATSLGLRSEGQYNTVVVEE